MIARNDVFVFFGDDVVFDLVEILAADIQSSTCLYSDADVRLKMSHPKNGV